MTLMEKKMYKHLLYMMITSWVHTFYFKIIFLKSDLVTFVPNLSLHYTVHNYDYPFVPWIRKLITFMILADLIVLLPLSIIKPASHKYVFYFFVVLPLTIYIFFLITDLGELWPLDPPSWICLCVAPKFSPYSNAARRE